MTGLVLYERMVASIAACERVDEAKDIRDKAIALQAYYRQSQNTDAERQASNIRLRAERQAGILLKQLARADSGAVRNSRGRAGKGKEPMSGRRTQVPQQSPYAKTLADTGMTRQQAGRFQALAAVPKKDFEAALAGPEVPTAERIAGLAKVEEARSVDADGRKPVVSDRALWVWGTLCDFERDGYVKITDVPALFSEMTDRRLSAFALNRQSSLASVRGAVWREQFTERSLFE